MKGVVKTVYYCDYCDTKSLKEESILVHERYCMANPNRICSTEKKTKEDRLIQSYLTAMSAINLASFLLVSIQNETNKIKDFKYFNKTLDETWEGLCKNLESWTEKKHGEFDKKYIIKVELVKETWDE